MAKIVRWNPVREMATMQSAMDRLFEETWRNYGNDATIGGSWLALNVYENDANFVVEAELPGINPDDVDITLHENTLTITGEVVKRELAEGEKVLLTERGVGRFRRTINLPVMVDADHVQADYQDGILTLTLPKSEAARPRQISIRRNSEN